MVCWNSYSTPGSPEYKSGVITNKLRLSHVTTTSHWRKASAWHKITLTRRWYHVVLKGKSAQPLLRKEGVLPVCYQQQSGQQSRREDGCRSQVQAQAAFGTFRHWPRRLKLWAAHQSFVAHNQTTDMFPQSVRTSKHTANFHTSCSTEDHGNNSVDMEILTNEVIYTNKE